MAKLIPDPRPGKTLREDVLDSLGMSVGLQLEYDLRTTRQARQREIDKAVRPRSAAA